MIRNKPQTPTDAPVAPVPRATPKPTPAPTPAPTKAPQGASCAKDSDCADGRLCFRGICYGGKHVQTSVSKHNLPSGVYRIKVVGLDTETSSKKSMYFKAETSANSGFKAFLTDKKDDTDYSQLYVVLRHKRFGTYRIMQVGGEGKKIWKPYRYLDAHSTFDKMFRAHMTSFQGNNSQEWVFEYATEKSYRIRQVGNDRNMTYKPVQEGGFYRYLHARVFPSSKKGMPDDIQVVTNRIKLIPNQLWQFEKAEDHSIEEIRKAPGVPAEFLEAFVDVGEEAAEVESL